MLPIILSLNCIIDTKSQGFVFVNIIIVEGLHTWNVHAHFGCTCPMPFVVCCISLFRQTDTAPGLAKHWNIILQKKIFCNKDVQRASEKSGLMAKENVDSHKNHSSYHDGQMHSDFGV